MSRREEVTYEGCCGIKTPHRHVPEPPEIVALRASPSSRAHTKPCGETWPGEVALAFSGLRFGLAELALEHAMKNKQQRAHHIEVAREQLRARHVMKTMKTSVAQEIKDAFVRARFGDSAVAKAARKGKGDATVHRTVLEMQTKYPRTIDDHGLKAGNPYIKRNAKYRKNCKHRFKRITIEWKQCKRCSWCAPRLPGEESYSLRLPPILEGRELPPLSEDQQWINMRNINTLAGFVLSKRVRAQQVYYSFKTDPYIHRYGLQIKFKDGWKEAGVFFETAWYRILPVLQQHGGEHPKKLWRAVQKELGLQWRPPWKPFPPP